MNELKKNNYLREEVILFPWIFEDKSTMDIKGDKGTYTFRYVLLIGELTNNVYKVALFIGNEFEGMEVENPSWILRELKGSIDNGTVKFGLHIIGEIDKAIENINKSLPGYTITWDKNVTIEKINDQE